LHNLVHASPRIYSGSEPEGEAGFASLAELGIRTVVSVDGARPNVDLARQHGLRYVHVPIGYDSVPQKAGDSLARLVRETEGPIYVHCHHGQHRGPAAAAVACIAAGELTASQGREVLQLAGTGQNYPGLWRDVAGYAPPARNAALPELVEAAEVESIAAAMAKIDRNFDNLKLCQAAGWSVPAGHPDVVARQEAVILKEGLREALRNLVADRPAEFQARLEEATHAAEALEGALQRNDAAGSSELLQRLEQSCKKCHAKYRNG
jgi:cytochrome c556